MNEAVGYVSVAATSHRPLRIDTHAHYLPDFYREAALAAGFDQPDGMPALPDWDVQAALEMMDGLGISTAILSISSPGVHFGDAQSARKLARRVNEYGAELVVKHADRFGIFASLPLPDVEGAIAEARYALDELGADGIVLLSNHGGIYPGDERFDPLMAQLDSRNAVLFLHPTSSYCGCCQDLAFSYPRPMIEFMFEGTRALTRMLLAGMFDRFPNIRFIMPHAGEVMPVLVDRIAAIAPLTDEGFDRGRFLAALRRIHYDLAGFPLPRLAPPLLQMTDINHLLYGSDWPFTALETVEQLSNAIDSSDLFNDADRHKLRIGNACRLFPRLSSDSRAAAPASL